MTLLYRDDLFLRHETGRHPERPDRLRAVTARLLKSGLLDQCHPGSYQPLDPEEVARVHAPEMVAFVRQACEVGGGRVEADTVVSPESYQVALAAAGACCSAVDAVLRGEDRTALCLVRPPGHHATPDRVMGFCLFNSVALAARRARDAHGLSRVLVVDWDVHHGNGTQDIFYDDPSVFFLSVHRYGHGFYPGTGAADETGTGPGLGCTANEPVRFGTPAPEYRDRFLRALEHAAGRSRPELILVSAGFDAHAVDPIGSLGLDTGDFAELTRFVLEVARVHCGGRVVSCLEGGYDLGALADSVQAHLEQLLTR